MNTIEELIQKECPEGVEFKTLGEVLLSLTTGLNPRNFFKLNPPDAKYYYITIREFKGGHIHVDDKTDRINDEALKLCNNRSKLEIGDVLFSGTGTIGETVTIKKEPSNWNIKEGVYSLKPNKELILSQFLVYILRSKSVVLKIKDKIAGGTVKSIPMKELAKIEIPVPPLSVQHKIVEILDKFTSLEAELEAELEARKKQYEYYRNQLLDFTGREDVEWKPIKQLFETRNGYTPSKNNPEYWENGDIPWFRMEDIRANGRILSDSILHVNKCGVKGNLFPKDSLIVATSATIGEHALIKCESLSNQRFTYLMLKSQYKDRFDIKFLFYYCFVLDYWCLANVNQGGFASVNMPAFYDFQFPVPSLAEQDKIASILDKFEELINGQTASLSAEIKARHQQYEYYRDRLLTFSRKEN